MLRLLRWVKSEGFDFWKVYHAFDDSSLQYSNSDTNKI